MQNPTVRCLNEAFKRDPNAIHTLVVNRVPCNEALADDPLVVVHKCVVLPGNHSQVGLVGVLNGVLAANNLPLVAAEFFEPADGSRATMVGFCELTQ